MFGLILQLNERVASNLVSLPIIRAHLITDYIILLSLLILERLVLKIDPSCYAEAFSFTYCGNFWMKKA